MPSADLVAIAASINQRLGQLQAAQTAAQGTVRGATITAAVAAVAAVLSLIGVVLNSLALRRNGFVQARATQQLKHADFRQSWIDRLREEMASFLRLAAELRTDPGKEAATVHSMAAILLRMNRKDPRYGPLVDAMDAVVDAARGDVPDAGSYGAAAAAFLVVCQSILKAEWETTRVAMLEEPPTWKRAGTVKAKPGPEPADVRMPRNLEFPVGAASRRPWRRPRLPSTRSRGPAA